MLVFDAPVSLEDLTTFVRRVPVPSNLVLSNLFPTQVRNTSRVNFAEITKHNRTARFRSYDGRIHVSGRDAAETREIPLPALSDSRNRGEYERLREEMLRVAGTDYSAMEEAIYNDGQDLTTYVHNRMEQAIGDVLFDGVLNADGVGDLDYGVDPGNLPTTSQAVLTDPAALFLDELVSLCDAYESINGFRPGGILTSRKMTRAFNTNTQVIDAVKGAQTGVTRVSLNEAASVLEDEGIPSNWRQVETQLEVDDKGTTARVLPDNAIVFLPPNPDDLIEIRYGLTVTGMELANSSEVDMSFSDAPGIVGIITKDGPPFREFVYVDAAGMPVLKNRRLLFTAKAH